MLERKDNQTSYTLTKEELAKLLISKMKLNPKSILKLDTSSFRKIHVKLAPHMNPETFVNLPAYDIRDGLRVRYYKPHHRKDVLVTINWMDIETPDELLTHVLKHFGKVKSNIKWMKVKEEEGESHIAKMLNSVLCGERQVWMEITTPLPSYAMIDNRKVKIYHAGQRRTCVRMCEENDGVKVNVSEVWKETLLSLGYLEWKGEVFDVLNEKEIENN